MLLAIDAGNTDVVFGLHSQENWQYQWRISSQKNYNLEQFHKKLYDYLFEADIQPQSIDRMILSSVVPDLNPVLISLCQTLFNQAPIVLGPTTYTSLDLAINHPDEIGADLVANAVAAWNMYEDYCIVVDFGTALTFTTIAPKAKVLGVTIAPGLKTAMGALFSNTAQLMEVPLEIPKTAIGKDTVHALQSGILLGYVGLVESLLNRIQAEVGHRCRIIATGGLSSVLTPLHHKFDRVDRSLTLEGLRIIAEKYEG